MGRWDCVVCVRRGPGDCLGCARWAVQRLAVVRCRVGPLAACVTDEGSMTQAYGIQY